MLTLNSSKSTTNGCPLLNDGPMLIEGFWLRMWRVYGWQKRFYLNQCILARWLFNLRNPFPYRPVNRGYFYCITPQLYVIYRALSFAFGIEESSDTHWIICSRRESALIRTYPGIFVANHSKLVWRLAWYSTAVTCSRMFSSNPQRRQPISALAVSRPWSSSEWLNAIRLMTTSSGSLRCLFWS